MRAPAAARRGAWLVALALLGACPADPPTDGEPPPRRQTAGTIRLGYPEEPATLNPVTESSPAATDILRAVLPSFFLVAPDLTYRPYLLEGEPEVVERGDRMTVRFRIRADARWSDGRPITTRDVAFTMSVMTDARLDVARPDGFDHVVAVRTESRREGVLVLSPPLASWRDLFSGGRFVLPAHAAEDGADVGDWNGGPPVSAGPYRLGRWVRGRSLELLADPRFFGPAALTRRIRVGFVPDPTTAVQLLERERLDVLAPMLGIRWSQRLENLDGVTTSGRFGVDLVALTANTLSVPSEATRRALADAIDRERFLDVALADDGRSLESVLVPEQDGAIAAWSRFGVGSPEGDLEASGELTLVYLRGELLDLLARYVQAEVERAGGDLELLGLESDVLRGRFLARREFDLALLEVRGTPFPDLSLWAPEQGSAPPLTELSDPRLAALQGEVERAGEGTPALARAQRLLARSGAVLPMFQIRSTVAWAEGVRGIVPNPSVDGLLWNASDWSVAEPG